MKKSKILGILTLIIFVILIATIIITMKFSNVPAKNCKIDSDCVKIQTTCCSCSMGGEEKCVSKSEVGEYKSKLENCSKDLNCIAMFNCVIDKCICDNRTCVSSGGK